MLNFLDHSFDLWSGFPLQRWFILVNQGVKARCVLTIRAVDSTFTSVILIFAMVLLVLLFGADYPLNTFVILIPRCWATLPGHAFDQCIQVAGFPRCADRTSFANTSVNTYAFSTAHRTTGNSWEFRGTAGLKGIPKAPPDLRMLRAVPFLSSTGTFTRFFFASSILFEPRLSPLWLYRPCPQRRFHHLLQRWRRSWMHDLLW